MKLELHRILPRLATALAAVLMIFVVFNGYSSLNQFQLQQQKATVQKVKTQNLAQKLPQKKISANKLVSLHVFGKQSPKQIAKTESNEKSVLPKVLPKTKIKLDIKGLFSNSNAKRGLAVISNKGQDKSYKVGDEIDKNIKLHAVYSGYVVIANNDKLERLDLPEFRAASGNPNSLRNLASQKRVAMKKQENLNLEVIQ